VPGRLVGVAFAMTEIADFALILLVVAGSIVLAVASTKLTARLPLPPPAIFLLAAAVASDIWPSLYAHVPILTVERIAVVALIVILFNGGMDIGARRFRDALGPILTLGLLGTFATAGIVAVFAHYALGFAWLLAGIVGAALAPTDPAVMFSVLGQQEIQGRSGTTLEGEAGVNDPAGIALMIGMIELALHENDTILVIVREFLVEMAIGTAIGVAGALVMARVLERLTLPNEALSPVVALVLAMTLYGVTASAHGSGFLAVFIAGLVVGEIDSPYQRGIERFHGSLATLAEIAVFIALGVLVSIGSLSAKIWLEGIALMVMLALVARPLVVFGGSAPFRFTWSERAFVAWSGLKGAVPILLAAFALLAGLEDADTVLGIVFVVVLLSVAIQGTLLPWVARRLRIPIRPAES
jgi:cell volume regulation protein A